MRIIWYTWKDHSHPEAGGAETVNEELARRLVAAGHAVTFVVAGYRGAVAEESRDGFRVLRIGNRWSVYLRAWLLYRERLAGTADLVIDEINTVPFFCRWYVREHSIVFAHQLARRVWFHEIFFPLNVFGWLLEPLYLRLVADRIAVTVSESSRRDLVKAGFRPDRIRVIPEGTVVPALSDLAEGRKDAIPTVLAFGSVRSMKRTIHAIRAFELAKRDITKLRLVVAGAPHGSYGRKVARRIAASPFSSDISRMTSVSESEKTDILTRAHLVLATSAKEGWCLVVTEANRRGTPAVVYDVDGLRDSVRHGDTGLVVPDGDVQAMAQAIVGLLGDHDGDRGAYDRLRKRAWTWGSTLDFDASARAFVGVLDTVARGL